MFYCLSAELIKAKTTIAAIIPIPTPKDIIFSLLADLDAIPART